MYREPETWHALLDVLAEQFARYVAAQVDAGADVIQLFDSWVGALSPADYDEFVAPYSARILAAVDVPTIHFGTGRDRGAAARARARRRRRDRPRLAHPARPRLGASSARTAACRATSIPRCCSARGSASRLPRSTCSRARAAAPGHIFNLGHGVLPQTDPGVLTRLAALVQERTVEARV